ncbi:hypothetical protein [Psittacicella gerlachiana]|uniref:Uncharacterized protein n=1 Tax=Psittacicella gerlachiana TaxID=2028574 RepID=A0A3A1YI26_9GAMM|nr:hypothetical protein [Psittacicella gerlachiana]RIY37106.1 hypothetical protein CKF59_02045 [Psittacicella gerlachiana]
MKDKMKNAFDRSSYTKLYIYAAIIILAFVLYLFVFRDTSTNKDSILLAKNETATVVINNQTDSSATTADTSDNAVKEQTPSVPVENTDKPAEVTPATPVATATPAPTPSQPATSTSSTSTTAGIPTIPENQIYANLETHEITVKRGQTAGAIFANRRADIFAMVAVDKAIERLGENDKLYVKYNEQGKIVVLSIEKRRTGYAGQYVLNLDNRYVFLK